MTTDFRALCAELLIALENAISIIYYEDGTKHISTAKPIVNRARAALADEPAVPQPPTEGEVEELVAWLRSNALTVKKASGNPANGARQRMNRAAELLQRLSPPQPVAVSKRPPEDQLCWWFEPDEEDDEAYGSSWTLLRICGGTSSYTHWLPAHALPIPQQQETVND